MPNFAIYSYQHIRIMGYISEDRRKVTTQRLREMKLRGEKISMLTSYDYTMASIVDSAGNTMIAEYTQGQPIPAGGHYKGAEMTNALQLTTGGVWMHEGIVTSAPESHGCIRLPKKMAKIFFDNTSVGDTVIIK